MSNTYLAGALSGFVGGMLGAYVVGHFAHVGPGPRPAQTAAPVTQADVAAGRIRLVDETGRTRAELAMSPDGGPGLFFYDTGGRNRLVLGLYAPAEREDPFVVLNDTRQRAAGIFRLVGTQWPVLVLKSNGADRSILGLNPGSSEPFLVNYAADGKKTAVFGAFGP
jgi:hypothetical protein